MPVSHPFLGVAAAHGHSAVIAAGSSGSGSSGGGGGSSLVSFLPLILIVVVGYLLLVRPARNRQRKAMENRAAIEPGVEVTTTAGLIATVVAVNDDDTVTLEVAPGINSRYLKGAIARVHSAFEDEAPTGEHEAIPDPHAGAAETQPNSAETPPPADTPPDQTDH